MNSTFFFNGEKKYITLFLLLSLFLILLIQSVFMYSMISESKKIDFLLRESFRKEINKNEFIDMASVMQNLESGKLISCPYIYLQRGDGEMVPLLQSVRKCKNNVYLLLGFEKNLEVISLDGRRWRIKFFNELNNVETFLLYLLRISSLVLCFFGLSYFQQNSERARIVEEKVNLFMKGIAHDIQSPLMAVKSVISHPNFHNDQNALGILNKALQRFVSISDKVLENKLDVGFEKGSVVSIVDCIAEIVTEKKLYIARANKNISVDYSWDKKYKCIGESVELKRVLSNIINNSIEADNVSAIGVQVFLRKKFLSKKIEILISDNGNGFEKKLLDYLGENEVVSTKRGGQGIGLLMASETVKKFGGTIKFFNQKGARVQILFNAKV